VGKLTLVWAVINEIFPSYAPFSRQALKSKVSFQALMDAPGKFGEGLQWVKIPRLGWPFDDRCP
jgi:hypothetical protein